MSHKPITDEVRMDICRGLGAYKRPIEIQKELKDKGISVQLTSIHYYIKKAEWRNIVDKFRREYLSSIMEVPIAQKVHRLKKLDDLIYGLEHNDGRFKLASDRERYDRILRTLDLARLEMEPSKHDTYNINMAQFNSLTDEEIKERKTQLMEKVLRIQKSMEEMKDGEDSHGDERVQARDSSLRVEERSDGKITEASDSDSSLGSKEARRESQSTTEV